MKIKSNYPAPIDPISQKFAKTSDDIPLKYVTYESREKNCFDVKQQKNEKKSIKKIKYSLHIPSISVAKTSPGPRSNVQLSQLIRGWGFCTPLPTKATSIQHLHIFSQKLRSFCTQTYHHHFEAKHPLPELFSTSRRS